MYQCQLCAYGFTRRRVLMRHMRIHHGTDYESAMQWAARSGKVDSLRKPLVTGWDIVRAAATVMVIAATLWILW